MNKYETIFIAVKNISREEIEKIISEIKKIVTVEDYEEIGAKKLAYEIKGNKEGYYIMLNIIAEDKDIKELEKYYRAEDLIIKFITVKNYDE